MEALRRMANQQKASETFVYKTIDEVPILADVYPPGTTGKRPVIVWLHGGR